MCNYTDRLSRTFGAIVLCLFEYGTWCAAQIMETCKSQDAFPFGVDETLTDYVTVIYDLGNGTFDPKKVCRLDSSQIKYDERCLRDPCKLQRHCMVGVFNPSLNQWIHSYIKSFGSINNSDSIIGTTRDCGPCFCVAIVRFDFNVV